MREELKDTLLFGCISTFNGLFINWFILFPYLGSYLKCKHPNLMISHFFIGFLFIYLGFIIGAKIVSLFVPQYGIQKLYYITGVCYFFIYIIFLQATCAFHIFVITFFSGILVYAIQLANFTYFKIKYPVDYNHYFGFISIGQVFTSIFALFLMRLVVNPNNEPMDYMQLGEAIFPPSVSSNLPRYIWIQAIFSSFGICLVAT